MSIKEKILDSELWRSGKYVSSRMMANRFGYGHSVVTEVFRQMVENGEAQKTNSGFNETMYRKPERHWIHGMRLA